MSNLNSVWSNIKNEGTMFFGPNSQTGTTTIISKFVFIILIVILFILLLRFGTTFFTWLFTPSSNPHLTSGLKDAKKLLVIPQNPNNSNSIPIIRSNNQRGGMEFTWTVWLFIDDLHYRNGHRRHVFHKGSEQQGTAKKGERMAFPNNGPGLYIHPTRNSLIVVMNTFKNIVEEVEVSDIPLNKWINVGLRMRGKVLDVFINGDVALRHVFSDVPKQNYGDVFVNQDGGFSGSLSDLWYHDYALSGTEILTIVNEGPDLTTDIKATAVPPFLSLQWYFNQGESPSGANWPTDSA
jgi:hypothetical protein